LGFWAGSIGFGGMVMPGKLGIGIRLVVRIMIVRIFRLIMGSKRVILMAMRMLMQILKR
jgi:hypothetical protein